MTARRKRCRIRPWVHCRVCRRPVLRLTGEHHRSHPVCSKARRAAYHERIGRELNRLAVARYKARKRAERMTDGSR